MTYGGYGRRPLHPARELPCGDAGYLRGHGWLDLPDLQQPEVWAAAVPGELAVHDAHRRGLA